MKAWTISKSQEILWVGHHKQNTRQQLYGSGTGYVSEFEEGIDD